MNGLDTLGIWCLDSKKSPQIFNEGLTCCLWSLERECSGRGQHLKEAHVLHSCQVAGTPARFGSKDTCGTRAVLLH